MLIISTAGHVDHGKTSIIKALNDFNGDSSPEEIKRQITIDLSFSHLQNISFVDVPGHESLVKTMISGVQSSFAMLVVDINEGLMPQTLEHIFILKIMRVENIILVLNKIDLCQDVQKRSKDILNQLDFTPLKCFFVSAKTMQGIDELKQFLLSLKAPTYEDFALKINIDRIFHIKGIGEVATGILKSGTLECKSYVTQRQNQISVKAIQVQHKDCTSIAAPARVAFAYKGDLKLGDTLCSKGYLRTASEIYTSLKGELKHDEKVLFCVANKQVLAKYIDFSPYAKFVLDKPMALSFDEPFVILKNARVVAGGSILSPITEPLKKPKMLKLLDALNDKDYKKAFCILNENHSSGFGLFCAPQRFNLSLEQALNYALQTNEILDEAGACLYTQKALDKAKEAIIAQFNKNPNSLQSAKSLEKSLGISKFLCELALKNIDFLDYKNGLFYKKGEKLEKIIQKNEDLIYDELNTLTPKAPYNLYDELNLDRKSGDDILKKLCKINKIKRLAHNYFLSTKALDDFINRLKNELKDGCDVQNLKSNFNLSRKYAIAILEYLDTQKNVKNIDNKRYFL